MGNSLTHVVVRGDYRRTNEWGREPYSLISVLSFIQPKEPSIGYLSVEVVLLDPAVTRRWSQESTKAICSEHLVNAKFGKFVQTKDIHFYLRGEYLWSKLLRCWLSRIPTICAST